MTLRWRPPTVALAVLAVLAVLYTVGLAGHLVPVTRPLMLALTPWFLVVSGVGLFVVVAARSDRRSLVLWALPTFAITYGLEVLGVATGAVFGAYHYTPILGTLVAGVPPVIGWNWVLVVLGAVALVKRLVSRWPETLRIVVVGVLCVGFDLLLEPVAIHLGYWVWHAGAVPVQNYVAWGLIAAAGAWWAGRFPRLSADPVWPAYAVLQAAFFAALGLSGVTA
jgi:putative membrane protein